MKNIFLRFIEHYCSEKPPLLLALSGGPDSMALFHILLECGYPFEVAHVDHGWRKESGVECELLFQMCQQKGIQFHSKKLSSLGFEKNLEDRGRQARLSFFKSTIEKQNLGGVLLAHHADDHAETVLKRLFEGASLPKLKGILPKIEWKGMQLYRPLLKVRKDDILKWLKENKITYFLDPTNQDSRFLRSRLRNELLPTLSATFGKEISSNLCRLGESAAELDSFLSEITAPYLKLIEHTPEGPSLNFQDPPRSLFLWKTLIRSFFETEGIVLSQTNLEAILGHLQKGNCHKSLIVGKQEVLIHRNRLIIKRKSIEQIIETS